MLADTKLLDYVALIFSFAHYIPVLIYIWYPAIEYATYEKNLFFSV